MSEKQTVISQQAAGTAGTPDHLRPAQPVGAGRFMLQRRVGGGRAAVWLARDEQARESVALKFVPPEVAADGWLMQQLRTEVEKCRKLSHPNIVLTHGLHEIPGETAFIAMEWLDGPDLGTFLLEQPRRVVEWKFLAPLVPQLCAALEQAHGERVLHGDLRPGKLVLAGPGRLKVVDFGIAAIIQAYPNQGKSRPGAVPTVGELPKVSDDIQALGETLCQLLLGRAPGAATSAAESNRGPDSQSLQALWLELKALKKVPLPVCELILACLATNPEDRPQDMSEVLEMLEPVEEGSKVLVTEIPMKSTIRGLFRRKGFRLVVIGFAGWAIAWAVWRWLAE